NTVLQIKKDFLTPIQEMVRYDSLSILEYTSRKQLLDHVFAEDLPKPKMTIAIEMDSITSTREYTIPTSTVPSSDATSTSYIKTIAKMGYDGIQAIANEVKETLAQEKRQNELANLEEEIIVQNDSLVMFIDSMGTSLPVNYLSALRQLKSFASTTLNDYSKVKSAQNRLTAARSTLTCLKNLNELSVTVSKMPTFKST
ncbi:unnamed protein product, partial [Ectocarpus sp. 12 AP-2014]